MGVKRRPKGDRGGTKIEIFGDFQGNFWDSRGEEGIQKTAIK